jgi:hypothetical protein
MPTQRREKENYKKNEEIVKEKRKSRKVLVKILQGEG